MQVFREGGTQKASMLGQSVAGTGVSGLTKLKKMETGGLSEAT